MFKTNKLTHLIRLYLAGSLVALSGQSLQLAHAQEGEVNTENESENEKEVIEITGIRSSLKESLFIKKNAQQIMDSISSEDIGQLPDTNVAEALSRVTGVQINRNDAGDGEGFQIRGLSQNRVEVNGRSMVSNGDGSRTNSFSSTSSALFKAIEVIKSPTADTVEGALGATIRLKTFKPLDFKKDFTYAGNFQYVAQDNENNDKGIIASSLIASRWQLGKGDIGALVNVSYEDRDITTVRWGSTWNVPQARPNTQCNSGAGNDALGVFDPQQDDLQSPHPCYEIAQGTIYQADGSISSGINYPVSDLNYGRDTNGNVPAHFPLLNYSVIHPGEFTWERKPFHNKKTGLDINLQWAPNSNFDMYIQTTYQKFDQLRPQNKIIIPSGAGGSNSRLQDGFVIQEFSRPTTGNEYLETSQVTDMPLMYDNNITGYLTPATGDITHGVLLAGTLSDDAVRFANNNQNKQEEQLILATGFTYSLNDLVINGEVSKSTSETFTDALNLNMSFAAKPYSTWDFTDGHFDLPTVGLIGPNTTYDAKTDTCNTNQIDPDSPVSNPTYLGSIKDPNCGADLLDWTKFTFGSFNGTYTWFDNAETSAKLDFDYYIDKSIFTTLEFGIRLTTSEISRKQTQLNDVESPNSNPEIKNNIDAVLGDLNQDGISGDATSNYVLIEDLEPGFVLNGLAQTPSFIENYSASTLFPRTWLTQVNNEQYNLWFDRVTGRAFWRDNTAQAYSLKEDSQAFYLKANFESELFGVPYVGNIGTRFINYDFAVNSYQLMIDEQSSNVITEFETVTTLNGISVETELEQVEELLLERSISKVLPSGNISFALQDNMFIRFAAAKVMAMPNPTDLVTTAPVIRTGASGVVGHNTGNINIEPFEANQYDFSYEWYMSDTSAISAALFRKDLKTFITKTSEISVINDELLLNTKKPINTDGGKVNGVELSYRSTFDFLPDFWSGFGIETNYTFTDSSQKSSVNELTGKEIPIENLSENSYNFILFYDKFGFQFRAAYNYRDTNFKGINNGQSDRSGYLTPILDSTDASVNNYYKSQPYSIALGEYEKSRGTLDLSMNYKLNKHITFSLQGSNVTNEPLERYEGVPGLVSGFIDPGASYRAGVRVSFR